MDATHLERLFGFTLLGVVAFLVGFIGLVFRPKSAGVRNSLFFVLATATVAAWWMLPSVESHLFTLVPILELSFLSLLLQPSVVEMFCSGLRRVQTYRRPLGWGSLAVVGGWMVGSVLWEIEKQDRTNDFNPEDLVSTVELEPIELVAYTDQGRTIPLSKCSNIQTNEEMKRKEQIFLTNSQHRDHIIRVGEADMRYNCHGWVFTGGRHWLSPLAVDTLLEDDGYREMSTPQPGDVAIYRLETGGISHTGLVRAVLPDGIVLVESKWGQMGRFLHRADQHPYQGLCTYYRSERVGHLPHSLEEVVVKTIVR